MQHITTAHYKRLMDHLKRPEDNSTDCMMSASCVKGVQMSYIRGNLVEGDTASIITRPQWPAGDNSCSKSCLWAGDSTYTDLMMSNRTVTPSGGQYNKIKKALIWDIFRRSCQRFERSNAGSKLILPSSKGWCQYKSSYLPISVSLDRHEGRNSTFDGFYWGTPLTIFWDQPTSQQEGLQRQKTLHRTWWTRTIKACTLCH